MTIEEAAAGLAGCSPNFSDNSMAYSWLVLHKTKSIATRHRHQMTIKFP
jgi:hypothetical protein